MSLCWQLFARRLELERDQFLSRAETAEEEVLKLRNATSRAELAEEQLTERDNVSSTVTCVPVCSRHN